jgi:hypothetical protein
MNRGFFVSLALVVAASLPMVGAPTTPEETAAFRAAMNRYQHCLDLGTSSLDDNLSDAATIARAVIAFCRLDYEDYVMANYPGEPSRAREKLAESTAIEESVLIHVLRVRADRRGKKSTR